MKKIISFIEYAITSLLIIGCSVAYILFIGGSAACILLLGIIFWYQKFVQGKAQSSTICDE